jgi:hypothetical protein
VDAGRDEGHQAQEARLSDQVSQISLLRVLVEGARRDDKESSRILGVGVCRPGVAQSVSCIGLDRTSITCMMSSLTADGFSLRLRFGET